MILYLSQCCGFWRKSHCRFNAGTLYLSNPSAATLSAVTNRDISSIETIVGTSGDATMVAKGGQTSSVTFSGMGGDDYLVGAAGSDILLGGKGDDVLTGSDGDDTFIVSVSDEDGERDSGTDVITDFNPSDIIAFTGFGISKSQDKFIAPEWHLFQKPNLR